MDEKTFSLMAGVIFAVVALFHLVRIFNRRHHCHVANRLEIRQHGSRSDDRAGRMPQGR